MEERASESPLDRLDRHLSGDAGCKRVEHTCGVQQKGRLGAEGGVGVNHVGGLVKNSENCGSGDKENAMGSVGSQAGNFNHAVVPASLVSE